MGWFDNIFIPKDTFDKLIDVTTIAIVNELENVKKNIDVNEDGKVSIKEMKMYLRAIIKILKSFIKGL